ncbi:entericidin A/B family lipoprotein [Deefgea tanakiae]|jgi:entericidin B|uniref:Entericidin A/B family lipoprotein n=1 Tax=Deefgea tanakiae TaxID=2865840 RepID=A0ABX8ZER2_9NEIS|nr:entericidin A/B family lipoprotein [Deefgea tanakiae]QZA79354.1 entericidin A/B family lipoprotein [Deefgea tanakiae]
MLRSLLMCGLVLVLTACNTVSGIGQDIKKGGEAIEKAAK